MNIPMQPRAQTKGLVAVVDDDESLRRTVATVLKLEGFDVLAASDGADALQRIRGGPCRPGAIILDWSMPTMDGAAFRRAQCEDPALANIPVVVLTGDAVARTEAQELGVSTLLTKPVRLQVLLSVLAEMLRLPSGSTG